MINSSIRIIPSDDPTVLIEELAKIGVDPDATKSLKEKATFRLIRIANIDNRAANILKQQLLSLGGEAAVNREVANFKSGKSRTLLIGTLYQFNNLILKLENQPFGLKQIAFQIEQVLRRKG